MKIQQTDHLGNTYPSIKAMCQVYGISDRTYSQRLKNGWGVERALTTPPAWNTRKAACVDHLGHGYPSIMEMCGAYHVHESVYLLRRKRGWSLQEALTGEVDRQARAERIAVKRGTPRTDHLGKEYPSIKSMCQAYGILASVFQSRMARGMSLEDALTVPTKRSVRDAEGNVFANQNAMAAAYGISREAVSRQIKRKGVYDPRTSRKKPDEPCVDHLGNTYASVQEMADAYHVPYTRYLARRRYGWSVERALTERVHGGDYKDRIGETRRMHNGQACTITTCHNGSCIDVVFEDGTVVSNRSYQAFCKGHIRNPNAGAGAGTRVFS